MSSPIERFITKLRAAETRQQREVVMTVMEARDLHADITRLLLRMESLGAATEPEVISIELKGQDF